MESIRRALVLGLVLIAGTAMEQALSIGSRIILVIIVVFGLSVLCDTFVECVILSIVKWCYCSAFPLSIVYFQELYCLSAMRGGKSNKYSVQLLSKSPFHLSWWRKWCTHPENH